VTGQLAAGKAKVEATGLLEARTSLEHRIEAERSELVLLTAQVREAEEAYQLPYLELATIRCRRDVREAQAQLAAALKHHADALTAAEESAIEAARLTLRVRSAAAALAGLSGAPAPSSQGTAGEVLQILRLARGFDATSWDLPAGLRRQILLLVGA